MRSALALLILAACADLELPPDVSCEGARLAASDDSELATALAAATAGDCIVLTGAAYAGPIALPAGVTLVAAAGVSPTIAGGLPAVIHGEDGGAIIGIRVASGPAQGILIEATDFRLSRSQIFDVVESAVGIRCEDPGCLRGEVILEQIEVRRARAGVVVFGANTVMRGGSIAEIATTGLAGGGASYVANGGALTLDGAELSESDYGVVADGAGTVLSLSNAIVRDCTAAGIWAQRLRGTSAAPALIIGGAQTVIGGHAGIAVLVLDSTGVSIADATIEGTSLRTDVIGGMNVDLGDGLLVLEGSADVEVQATTLRDNARAQAIVDGAGANVVFGANSVDIGNGAWQVVVQSGGIPVTVPAEDLSTAPLLPVPSDPILLPSVGP